ncbi:MAG TPA: hypothetical protein VGV93_02545 [Acidimicrobiales bacterium]|nr:hypothetical protein [Acidimicrobiales bacterium]
MNHLKHAGADRRRFRRSSSLAGVGDGLVAVALPLLAAGLTRNPLAVASVVAAEHLPWAVLATVRRLRVAADDQRTVLSGGTTMRAAAVVVVGLLTLVGAETIVVLVMAALLIGGGAALADQADEEVVRLLDEGSVGTERLGADLRRRAMIGMAVIGLPLGGLIYEVAAALPFLVDVGVYGAAALSALSIRRPLRDPGPALPGDEGGWTISVPALAPRTGAVTLAATGAMAASSAVLGVLVLFAVEDLGLGAPAFGFLLAALAAAATVGAVLAPTVGAVMGLRAGAGTALVVSGAAYAAAGVLADPAIPYVGALALGVGVGAGMVATVLLRALLHAGSGRVVEGDALAAFHARVWAGVPSGALAGGVAASAVGVTEAVIGAGLLVILSAVPASKK